MSLNYLFIFKFPLHINSKEKSTAPVSVSKAPVGKQPAGCCAWEWGHNFQSGNDIYK